MSLPKWIRGVERRRRRLAALEWAGVSAMAAGMADAIEAAAEYRAQTEARFREVERATSARARIYPDLYRGATRERP